MKYRLISVMLLSCISSFSQSSMEENYKIYDTRIKQVITIDKIVADCAHADVLFFGELHNDSAGHYLENAILRALYTAYDEKIVLSMEMF